LNRTKRITLKANETQTVTLTLKAADLAYWSDKSKKFIVEKDKIRVVVGSSSADVKDSKTIAIN